MVDNNDLNFKTGGGQPSASNKAVRMHVMPEDIFSEDELHRKINKLPPKKPEVPAKPVVAPVVAKPEKKEVPVEETVETIIPMGLKRPTKQNKMSGRALAMIVILVLILLAGAGGGAWYFYNKNKADELDRDLDLIQNQDELQEQLAAEEAKKTAEEAAKAEAEKQARLTRDNQRILDIIALQSALKEYYNREKTYPLLLPGDILSKNDVVYLENVPEDPLNTDNYRYNYNSPGENYSIAFMLEEGINGLNAGIHSITNLELLKLNGEIQQIVKEEDTDLTQPIVLAASRDTDLDGVTDLEELMFGTDPYLFDSDEDTYTDHQEILNLYAPSGMAPQTLLDVGLVKEYYSEKQNYRIYYPSSWRMQAIDVNDEEVMFVSDQTEEYMTVKVEENVGELSLSQWIKVKMLGFKVNYKAEYYQEDFLSKKQKIQGIMLPELFMVFFEKDNKVYRLAYHFDGLKQLSYKTTFEMMAKSFQWEAMNLVEENNESDVLEYEEENATVESEYIENEIEASLETETTVENQEGGETENNNETEGMNPEEESTGDEIEEALDEFYTPEETNTAEESSISEDNSSEEATEEFSY